MMRTSFWLAGAAITALLTSTAAVGAVVVVRSLGPSAKAYPPGKTLPENSRITLQGGDVVTVLGPGSAKTLRGPGNFDPKQATLASAAGQRGRFGALRTGEIAHNPSIWDVDVTQSGKVCVANPAKLQLWRPESDTAVKVTITSSDGKNQELSWAAGKASAGWPSALPIATGASYKIAVPDGDTSDVSFVTVPSAPSDMVAAAQLLIENGCQNQLDLLVAGASKAGE
jgi:hypothetical protein